MPDTWRVVTTRRYREWRAALAEKDQERLEAAVTELEWHGPALGRPLADQVKSSTFKNMKELIPPGSNIRVLYAFDRERAAVLLLGGDKSGAWGDWYRENVPLADAQFRAYLGSRPATLRRPAGRRAPRSTR